MAAVQVAGLRVVASEYPKSPSLASVPAAGSFFRAEPPMIAPQIVDQIRQHLAEGKLTHGQIGALSGVSRGTVAAISSGRRADRQPAPPKQYQPSLEPTEPPERCPGCGGMVHMPCRLCQARAVRTRTPRRPLPSLLAVEMSEPLGLNLKEEHRRRYEQVRARRRECPQ